MFTNLDHKSWRCSKQRYKHKCSLNLHLWDILYLVFQISNPFSYLCFSCHDLVIVCIRSGSSNVLARTAPDSNWHGKGAALTAARQWWQWWQCRCSRPDPLIPNLIQPVTGAPGGAGPVTHSGGLIETWQSVDGTHKVRIMGRDEAEQGERN